MAINLGADSGGTGLIPGGIFLNGTFGNSSPWNNGSLNPLSGAPSLDTALGTGNYNVAQGLPGYMQGSDVSGLQNAQGQSLYTNQQQQNFTNALMAQQGLSGIQQGILSQQQGLLPQFQSVAGQFGNLAGQYGQMAAGQGPNPAQAQLAQNTGQNMQQTAALMASARGAQSNPGLIARQAGQAGANIQQQSAGQAATLQAQQQIAAMQGQQQAMSGQAGVLGQAGQQQGQMANLATAGVGQGQTALSQLNQNNLTYQQLMQQALTAQNQQQVQAQLGQAQLAGIGMQNTAGLYGGLMNGIGGMLSVAHGGVVPKNFDDGGVATPAYVTGVTAGDTAGTTPEGIEQQSSSNLPKSLLGKFQSGQGGGGSSPQINSGDAGASALSQGMSSGFSPKKALSSMGGGSGIAALAALSSGGPVRGKAKVKGDSLKNDTVPAMLSPGEIVIPRSHVGDPEKIASFLNGLLGTNFTNSAKRKAA